MTGAARSRRSDRVNFAFSEEQEELRSAVRRFLAEKSPEPEVRRLMDTVRATTPECGARWPINWDCSR